MNKLKGEQRERKRASRHNIVYRQISRSSSSSSSDSGSISSSDEEDLRRAAEAADAEADTEADAAVIDTDDKDGKDTLGQVRDDVVTKEKKKKGRVKDFKPGHREKHKQTMAAATKTKGLDTIE